MDPIPEEASDMEWLDLLIEDSYIQGMLVPGLTFEQWKAGLLPKLESAFKEHLSQADRAARKEELNRVRLAALAHQNLAIIRFIDDRLAELQKELKDA